MARIAYVDPATLDPSAREALVAAPPLNIFRMLAHVGRAFGAYTRFGAAVLVRMDLDPALRELAILVVAQRERAEYEWVQHVDLARMVGITEAEIAVVQKRPSSLDATLPDPYRAVVEFTDAVLRSPEVDDAIFDRLREHLPPPQVVELLMTIGNYLMLARVMTVLQIEPDPPMGAAVLETSTPRR